VSRHHRTGSRAPNVPSLPTLPTLETNGPGSVKIGLNDKMFDFYFFYVFGKYNISDEWPALGNLIDALRIKSRKSKKDYI